MFRSSVLMHSVYQILLVGVPLLVLRTEVCFSFFLFFRFFCYTLRFVDEVTKVAWSQRSRTGRPLKMW